MLHRAPSRRFDLDHFAGSDQATASVALLFGERKWNGAAIRTDRKVRQVGRTGKTRSWHGTSFSSRTMSRLGICIQKYAKRPNCRTTSATSRWTPGFQGNRIWNFEAHSSLVIPAKAGIQAGNSGAFGPLDTRLRGYDDNWDEASVSNAIALVLRIHCLQWALATTHSPAARPDGNARRPGARSPG
jgi:hypothetical protein